MYNVMWWVLVVLLALGQLTRIWELMGNEIKRSSLSDLDPAVRFVLLAICIPFWYSVWLIFLNARH